MSVAIIWASRHSGLTQTGRFYLRLRVYVASRKRKKVKNKPQYSMEPKIFQLLFVKMIRSVY